MIKVNLTSVEAENLKNFLTENQYDDYSITLSNASGIGTTIKVQGVVNGIAVACEEDITDYNCW